MNRRRFLAASAASTLLGTLPRNLAGQSTSPSVTLSLDTSASPVSVPSTFTGLSYETAQLSHPGYFSAKNKSLVKLVRRLGTKGILRIGGNTSDYAIWTPKNVVLSPNQRSAPVGPDAGLNINKATRITPESIDELRTFLDATGWGLIYGIDLGHGNPERAAEEAAYVVKRIGSSLVALQIGNEADLFYRNGLRTPSYTYADFFTEWKTYAAAIRKTTPNAPLAGPDVGNHIAWVESFAKEAQGINMLTSHFYAEGPPSDPHANIDRLLRPHEKNRQNMLHLVALGKATDLPYRMSECNSCYHGGKPGVSNTFASALWGADYMLSLAQWGVAGVNFHGGGQGFYTPIAGGGDHPLVARPLFYGMTFFREFAHGPMLPVSLNDGGLNLSAYASRSSTGKVQFAIINKDQSSDARLTISAPHLNGAVRSLALRAPAIDSTDKVTFGGSEITSDGAWKPRQADHLHAKSGKLSLDVPRASALLLTCEEPLHD